MRGSLTCLAVVLLAALHAACGSKGTFHPSHGRAQPVAAAGASATDATTDGSAGATEAGAGGAPSEPAQGDLIYGFDEDTQAWKAQYTSSADAANLIDVSSIGKLSWSEDGGHPGGALLANIPYDAPGQYVGLGIVLSSPTDLSGKTVTAEVQIVSGVGSPEDLASNPAGAKLYAKSGGSFVFAAGVFTNVDTIGKWITLRFVVDAPDYVDEKKGSFDPTQVREVGIQFDTGGRSQSATAGVLLVDNVRY